MLERAYYAAGAAAAAAQRVRPAGRCIYDHADEWDICIVLDSARADLLAECWNRDVNTAWSVGSITTEWLANTFHPRHADAIGDTGFVSATPHSTTVFRERSWLTNTDDVAVPYPSMPAVEPAAFDGFYEPWRTHADVHDAVPPATMRDATLEASDRHDRVVAHWLQPHEPFIAPDAELVGGAATAWNVWSDLQSGALDADAVWAAYEATLEYALEYVEEVCAAVDGRVLVTADHGNAFGEWGVYGHPFAWPQPAVRRVPWAIVSSEPRGSRDYEPVLGAEAGVSADKAQQLRALGYR